MRISSTIISHKGWTTILISSGLNVPLIKSVADFEEHQHQQQLVPTCQSWSAQRWVIGMLECFGRPAAI